MIMNTNIVLVVTLCSLVEICRRFEGTCCFTLKGSTPVTVKFYQTVGRPSRHRGQKSSFNNLDSPSEVLLSARLPVNAMSTRLLSFSKLCCV